MINNETILVNYKFESIESLHLLTPHAAQLNLRLTSLMTDRSADVKTSVSNAD